MRDFAIVFVHLIVTLARLARPGGLRSVVAESVLVRHQLLILNRGRKRAPNLRATDRIIAGLCTLFIVILHDILGRLSHIESPELSARRLSPYLRTRSRAARSGQGRARIWRGGANP